MRNVLFRLVACVVIVAVALPLVWTLAGDQPAAAAITPLPNPTIADACGLDLTLVLDASGSIQSSHAVEDVRLAAATFLDSLRNTGSTARVTQFGTVSAQLAPATIVDDAALAQGGPLAAALRGYYNPIPPRPGGVNFYEYRGGSPTSSSSFRLNNSGNNQYTNWDQALDQAGAGTPPKLVVFVTDGDPTAYDFEPTDPIQPPNVAFNTSGAAAQTTLDRAVVEANAIKSASTRMLTVGVGAALANASSVQRLVDVSGPQVVRDADLPSVDSINEIDVALVREFEDLAAFLRGVVLQLCSPSLTIRKLAQSADDAAYVPAPGWSMEATPSAPGGTFRWILPDATPAASKVLLTDANGFAQFQWEPDPPELDSRATVTETLQPGFIQGRPTATDYRCELRDQDGNLRVVEGDLGPGGTFTLDPIGQEVVTCTVWNSFDYAPAIAVTKVNAPTTVRGDLDPAATVTSTYQVTNPGNTPLSHVVVTDDQCAPVVGVPPTGTNQGDADDDGTLDPGETWTFTCARTAQASPGPAPINVVNTATAQGTDPRGTTVTDEATDDVDVYTPAITLTKLVDDQPAVVVATGTSVTYTYAVANTGNTPLGSVALVDDTPPCEAPTRGLDDPGNDDAVLDVGETWTYSCTATPSGDVTNTATTTATPLDPTNGDQPFPNPNPPVTATDRATVQVVAASVGLTKSADPTLVVVDPATLTPQPVTYTFEATNPGTAPLNRPGATTAGPTGPARQPGWVTDDHCDAPATYVSGDTDDDGLLDPGETWTFTCAGAVSAPTLNTADIVGQPSNPDGTPLTGIPTVTDEAQAFVDVVSPGLTIEKTALRPVVVDPAADVVSGPDLPPRPAQYLYEVTNTGTVDLALDPVTDDTCEPLVFTGGDTNDDELLGVGETWEYSCETTLTRAQGTPPPTGAESGLVTNTATATAVPSLDGTLHPKATVTDTDSAQVLVIEPGIAITKTASPEAVRADDAVTYTFVVSNTGDVGLDVLGPTDDQCSPLVFQDGDTNDNGILDGADSGTPEAWTYTCSRSVGLPEPPATTNDNTVEVGGVDPLGNLYTDSAVASVRVLDPAIHLEKSVSADLVPVGTGVTYTFEVTNTGTSPVAADDVLADVTLGDVSVPPVPECRTPTFVGGDTSGDGLLDRVPAETWEYTCSATIDTSTADAALVQGTAGLGLTPPLPIDVFDLDVAFVKAFQPAIEVVKAAAPTALVGTGGPVQYTYLVRNTGDVPLADVATRITDDTCPDVTYVSGDDDGDGLLDTPTSIFEDSADEVWTFTCTTSVAVTTTNTVTVTGTPTDPGGEPLCGTTGVPASCDVTDSSSATVTVTDFADVTLTKTASATTVFPGAVVTFTLTATNHGPGEARDVVITDDVPAGLTVLDVSPGCTVAGTTVTCVIGTLANGASASVDVVVRFEGTTGVTNVGSVESSSPDPDGGDNGASASVVVSGTLPRTGRDVGGLVRAGAVLALAGAALLAVTAGTRRRRRPSTS